MGVGVAWGGRIWSYSSMVAVALWGDGEVLEIDSGDSCTHCECN